MRRSSFVLLFVASACVCLAAQQPAARPQVTFRPRVTLVPIDVRAVDRDGRPINDLTAADFQVFQDGKRQDVAFFTREADGRSTVSAPGAAPSAADTSTAAEPRTFLIALGRGRLEGPFKGLTPLIDFVRTLGPADRVGVAAYDRISDLTTDHEAVARLLTKYTSEHERIEQSLNLYLQGLVLMHWDGISLLPSIQADIDRLFAGSDLPRFRRLPLLTAPEDEAFGRLRDDVEHRMKSTTASTKQDMRQLYTCEEFLRAFDGEKHLIFVTEQPPMAFVQTDKLAQLAADARVAISTIQTGGLPMNVAERPGRGADPFPGRLPSQGFAIEAFRAAATVTGGTFSAYEWPVDAIHRIAERTSSRYVLGYYPPDTKADGTFHNVDVRLTRPGATLAYRRGYFAGDSAALTNTRAAISSTRMTSAFDDYRSFSEVPVELKVEALDGNRVKVSLAIDPRGVQFADRDGRKTAAMEIAVAVGQNGHEPKAHKQEAFDLSFEPGVFAGLTREKMTYTTTLAVSGNPRKYEVKAIAYDVLADRLGSAVTKVR